MDRFDDLISRAKSEFQPSPDFSDRVMRSVQAAAAPAKRPTFGWPRLAASLSGLAVLGIIAVTVLTPSPSSQPAITSLPTDDFSTTINSIDRELADDLINNPIDASQLNDLDQ